MDTVRILFQAWSHEGEKKEKPKSPTVSDIKMLQKIVNSMQPKT